MSKETGDTDAKAPRREWSMAEDMTVAHHRGNGAGYDAIAAQLYMRTADAVRNRWQRIKHDAATIPPPEDDRAASAALRNSGGNELVTAGSLKRDRASWTAEEDALVLRGVLRFGKQWREVAKLLDPLTSSRTASSVRNRYKRLEAEQQKMDAANAVLPPHPAVPRVDAVDAAAVPTAAMSATMAGTEIGSTNTSAPAAGQERAHMQLRQPDAHLEQRLLPPSLHNQPSGLSKGASARRTGAWELTGVNRFSLPGLSREISVEGSVSTEDDLIDMATLQSITDELCQSPGSPTFRGAGFCRSQGGLAREAASPALVKPSRSHLAATMKAATLAVFAACVFCCAAR